MSHLETITHRRMPMVAIGAFAANGEWFMSADRVEIVVAAAASVGMRIR